MVKIVGKRDEGIYGECMILLKSGTKIWQKGLANVVTLVKQ